MKNTVLPPSICVRKLRKGFRRSGRTDRCALDDISMEIPQGTLVGLVGPDAAGKTTLLRLLSGLLRPQSGNISVLGIDVVQHPAAVQSRIGYMPQKFGLYEDLSVRENLDLYADLRGLPLSERSERYEALLEMTALGPFTRRLASRLSGGMKQKLGLACTLVRSPEVLLLDEPTVGVDPLSRIELWNIIFQLVESDHLTVVVSTTSLDEAARCHRVLLLQEGRMLHEGPPGAITKLANGRTFLAEPQRGEPARILQSRLIDHPEVIDAVPEGGRARFVIKNREESASPPAILPAGAAIEPVGARFEDGFRVLLRAEGGRPASAAKVRLERAPVNGPAGEVVVRVRDLVRRFGAFTAVDNVSFEVRRGEIFGLLGPNGAGKTTTFRMLCGLLSASSGELEVAGYNVRKGRDEVRQHLGYVAQKFSLYRQLSVIENLGFFASAYGLSGKRHQARIGWALEQFELAPVARLPSGQLPNGFQQRLSMAAALLHEPEILFLDEPTSGADPFARRDFWRNITGLAEQGVTVIVTTHFMEEAEYCDHIVIQDGGRIIARGTPTAVRGDRKSMEDAFISIVQETRHQGEWGAEP